MMRLSLLSLIIQLFFCLNISYGCDTHMIQENGYDVEKIVDSTTLLLKNGKYVRFNGLLHVKDWPTELKDAYEAKAIALITPVVKNKKVYILEERQDRYGRLVGDVHDENGVCLQEALLEEGLAIYSITQDDYHDAEIYQKTEKKARLAQKNIWSKTNNFLLIPEKAEKILPNIKGSFRIIGGTLKSVTKKKETIYLNFGEDWKTDTTIAIPARYVKYLQEKDIHLDALPGKPLYIRGIVDSYFGPLIHLDHRWQLEL